MKDSRELASSSNEIPEPGPAEMLPADREVMRKAFEAHYAALVKLGIALSGRRDTAEDIVQDAFIAAASHLGRLASDEVRPYLRKAVVNRWKNRVRRLVVEARYRRMRSGGEGASSEVDDRNEVWRAIELLPNRQRACVVLRYYEDLREREVADLLGCSVGTVKSQTARALARLRREIENEH